MAKKAKVKLDKPGIIKLMHDSGVEKAVDQAADVVAQSAGSRYSAEKWMRRTKYVANVVDSSPGALFREATSGNLARAISRLEK
jgi:hypothetical protein